MKPELIDLTDRVFQVLQINVSWMTWNLFLAFIPLALSVILFRKRQDYTWLWLLSGLMVLVFFPSIPKILQKVLSFQNNVELLQIVWLSSAALIAVGLTLLPGKLGSRLKWWSGFLVFYAFLPNAPYLLTDIIHFIDDIRTIQSVWMITLVLIPTYIIVILGGFEAYVLSLINFGYYLHRIGKSQWVFPMEMITHILCAVGIYLGRFLRFNSWDLITKPDELLTQTIVDALGKQPIVIMGITFIVLWGLYWIMKRVTLSITNQGQNQVSIQSQRINSNG